MKIDLFKTYVIFILALTIFSVGVFIWGGKNLRVQEEFCATLPLGEKYPVKIKGVKVSLDLQYTSSKTGRVCISLSDNLNIDVTDIDMVHKKKIMIDKKVYVEKVFWNGGEVNCGFGKVGKEEKVCSESAFLTPIVNKAVQIVFPILVVIVLILSNERKKKNA